MHDLYYLVQAKRRLGTNFRTLEEWLAGGASIERKVIDKT